MFEGRIRSLSIAQRTIRSKSQRWFFKVFWFSYFYILLLFSLVFRSYWLCASERASKFSQTLNRACTTIETLSTFWIFVSIARTIRSHISIFICKNNNNMQISQLFGADRFDCSNAHRCHFRREINIDLTLFRLTAWPSRTSPRRPAYYTNEFKFVFDSRQTKWRDKVLR